MITWTKARHGDYWNGAIGYNTYTEREAFGIQKVKPPSAPRPRLARVYKQRGDERGNWNYEYTLMTRLTENGWVRTVGRYKSIDEAKSAAEEVAGQHQQ